MRVIDFVHRFEKVISTVCIAGTVACTHVVLYTVIPRKAEPLTPGDCHSSMASCHETLVVGRVCRVVSLSSANDEFSDVKKRAFTEWLEMRCSSTRNGPSDIMAKESGCIADFAKALNICIS